MNDNLYRNDLSGRSIGKIAVVAPDFRGIDSAEDILRDAIRWGLVDDLRSLLNAEGSGVTARGGEAAILRDIGYELAGARNRDFAVDVFVHVTGIAEFGPASLRDYARKHGCSHEWFRKEAEAMRRRLGLAALTPPAGIAAKRS